MAGKNVRIAVHYKEESAQLLAAEISKALSTQTVSVTKIDVSQALSGLGAQLDNFFKNYSPQALTGLGSAISSALNTGINTTMMASAFEGISAGARSAATALNSLSEAEEKEKLAQSEYVRQAGIIQKQLQNFFKSGANGNALYAGLDNLKMKVSGEVATFTAINEKMGKTVSITANLSEGWGESKKNAAAFAQQIDKIAKISATIKAPLPSPSEASAQASNIFTAIKSASSNGSNPLLAGLSDWSIKFNDTTATITAQNKALGSTTQIIADLTKGYGASAQSAETFVKQLDSLARISTRINEAAAEKQVSLSNEEAQAQARTLFEQIKEVSAHSTSGPLQGLTDWTVKVSGMKATFSAINEEMGRSVTAEADLAKGMGANADLAAEWAKNIQSGTDKLSVTTKELPKLLSPTEASAQRDNILAALQTASADGSTPALAGLTDWQARLSGTKAIFTAINTDLKQSVSVTADLRTHVGDTAQSAAQFAQNLTAANISTKDNTSSLDSEATKLARLRSQAEQYLTLKGKILKENAPDVYNRLDSLYRKSFTPGAVSSSEFQKEYSAIQSQIFQTGADIQSLWQRIKSAGEIAFTFYNLYGVFNRVKRVVKDMVQTAGELNQSMTQLSIVSNESMKTIESNFGNISKAAKEAGADITDLMASMENYARMGYNMQESTDLAKLTSIYSNVGDISVDDATTSAVSILKAYGLSVNELKQAFDSMTKVDQDFAISTGDLGVAFQNTGSQLAATGASVNETIALITAANSSIQDASKTANALKTISMRLRSQNLTQKEREELSELSGEDIDDIVNNSSKYRNEILGMTGVDIKENESTYKSIYQIILEISKVWDHLSDTQRATLTEDIAGKRNSSVLMSLISNVDDMEAAYADAENAMGTLDAANAKYLDSIEGRQKAFQASYQSLAHTLVNSNFVKVFYDMGNGAMQFAEGLQKVGLLIPSVIAGLVALNAAMKTYQATSGVVKMLSAPTTTLESAVQVLGALPTDQQHLAGLMLQGMNPAKKSQISGANWLQAVLLRGNMGSFSGLDNDELKDIIKNNPDVVNLDAVENLAEDVGESISEGMKSGGKVAEKTTGTVFEALKAKVKAGLTGIRELLTGKLGTGAAVAGWAGVAVGIGALIYKAIDTINTKRIEAYRNLKTEISDTENKIREAQKQIDENNATIEEYTEKKIAAGALSLSDQTTLDTLKAEQNELQVNIEMWEAYAEARKAELSDKAWDALKADQWKHPSAKASDITNYVEFVEATRQLSSDPAYLQSLVANGTSDDYRVEIASKILSDRDTITSNVAAWVEANRDNINDLAYGTSDKIDEIIDSYHRFNASILANAGNWDSAFSTLINAPEFAKTKTYLEGIVDMYGGTADNISKMAEQIKADSEDKLNNVDLNKFLDTLEELGITVDRTDFTGLIMQFAQVEEAIDDLGKSTNSLYQFQNAMEGVDAEVDDWEKGEKKRKSGTEAFTSYAETYDELIDRVKQGFDEDDGIIAQDIERLIGKDKMFDLGGDFDAIMKHIKASVGVAFGDNDSLGSGLFKLLEKVSKGDKWKTAANGARELRDANNELIASFNKSDKRWLINYNHMEDAAKELGLTTEGLYALIRAVDTWSDVSKISDADLENNILNSGLGMMVGDGVKAVSKIELTAEWTAAGVSTFDQIKLLNRLTENPNIIVIDTEFTGNAKEDIGTLKDHGIVHTTKLYGRDKFGNRYAETRDFVDDLGYITDLIQQSGVAFEDAWGEVADMHLADVSGEFYEQRDILESLIDSYSHGTVKLEEFYDTINVGDRQVNRIKFASLDESLRNAGFTKDSIDKILKQLTDDAGIVRIKGAMSWDFDDGDLAQRLESMGIISKKTGGAYSIDIKALVQTTIDQGGSRADVEAAVEAISKNLPSLNIRVDKEKIFGVIDSEWQKAQSSVTEQANATADAQERQAGAAERTATATSGIKTGLDEAARSADGLTEKLYAIKTMAQETSSYYRAALAAVDDIEQHQPISGQVPGNATGKNKDKYSGLSLVGELGPEIRATGGMVEVVGKNGPEVITVGKEDIIIPADTTADILKKTGGAIDGIASNANVEGTDTRHITPSGNSRYASSYGGEVTYSHPKSSSSSSSSSSAKSAASKSKDAWERFYKDLKHRREMDEIDDKQYYAALEANYRNYLDTSEENLDTWQSVVEEIYKGNYSTLTDLWNNELAEWDHRIAMEEATEADKIAWMKSHYSEYLSDNVQQHKDYQKALEEIRSGEYKLLTDAWEKELAEWDHKIAMEEAEEAEKTEWMKANLGNYLSDNLTQHSDYEKALESIYDGEAEAQTKAWDEIKDNLDRQLAMNEISEKEYWARYAKAYRETLVGNQKKVAEERLKADKDYYEATKKLAEDAIKEQTDRLKRQLDNQIINNRNYLIQVANLYEKNYAKINELDKSQTEARRDALYELYSAQKTYASNNASDIKNLHDLVVEEIKDIKNQEIDQLEETAANLATIADLRKKAIDDLETENDYIRQQRNLQKSAAQIEAELEMMKSDTSAAGMAKRRKLQEQLISAQADLSDFEREHAISNQKKQIDEELKAKTDQLDEQKKAIQKYLANELQVSADAWQHINDANAKGVKGIKDLYDELSNYALSFGKDIQGEIDTVVAKFQEAMKAVTKDYGIAMKAFADSGMGPMAMFEMLEQAGVKFGDNAKADVAKAVREGGGDEINNGWNDMSEAAMYAALSSATDEVGASLSLATIATAAHQQSLQSLTMTQSKATEFTGEFEKRGISVTEVVNALNKKLAAEGSQLRANATDYKTLNKWLVDNEVSTYLFTKAVDDYTGSIGENKDAWTAAVDEAKKGTSTWLGVAAQFENINDWLVACNTSYGAFKLSLQSANTEILPEFEKFSTGLKAIKENSTALYETFDAAMTGITKSASNAQGGEDGNGGLHGILGKMNGDIDQTVRKLAAITPNAPDGESAVDKVKGGLQTVFGLMGDVVDKLKKPETANDDPMGLDSAAGSAENFHDQLKKVVDDLPGFVSTITENMQKLKDAQNDESTVNPHGFTAEDARKALLASAKLATLTPEEGALYDVDHDGAVTAMDARYILRMAAKLDAGIGFASGTPSVPESGLYTIDEGMKDELIYDPSKNALISYLNAKSIVFPADVSAKMKALYSNPSLLNTPIGSPSIPRMDATVNAVSVGDISMGDIIIQGNTNEKTIAQIRAEQKRQAQYIGAIFEREQRFAGTIR